MSTIRYRGLAPSRIHLSDSHGIGPDIGPNRPKPQAPGGNLPLPNPLQGLQDALATGLELAQTDIIAAGSVFLGTILIVAGLLLAIGIGGPAARGAGRAGLFVATRGLVR